MLTWFLLGWRLSLRGRVITSACHWRMFPSHLSVMRAHLGIMRNRLRLVRHLIGHMWSVSGTTSSSGCFAGMHFGLVTPSGMHGVALISGLELVPVCSGVACSRRLARACALKITFSYVPRLLLFLFGTGIKAQWSRKQLNRG